MVQSGSHDMAQQQQQQQPANTMVCQFNEDVKNQCVRTLAGIGASTELTNFYADAQQCEYDITHTTYRMHSKLKDDYDKAGTIPPSVVFGLLQTMTKHFRSWKTKIDRLAEQGIAVPPFQVDHTRLDSNVLTAVCSMETNELNLQEGDQLFITDSSHPNWLRVKNSRGEEGYLPAMSCIIPTPDNSAVTAVERLQILLLTSWTECIRKLRSLLMSSLTDCSQSMTKQWRTYQSVRIGEVDAKKDKLTLRFKRLVECASRSNKGVDLGKLHIYLSKLENDLMLINSANGLMAIKQTVESLDRAVLCYQTFYGQWSNFRQSLNEASRPIRIVEQWEELRRASQCNHFKYYEMKMTLEELETLEEINYVNSEIDGLYTSECRQKRQSVTSEELTSTTEEERKRFIIRGVVDPRTDAEVSFKKAVEDKIIDHRNGSYVNPDSGEGIPISEAMLKGRIIVEYTSVFRSAPKSSAVPLITIRHRQDRRYTITGAVDAITAERVDTTEAVRRGLIDETEGHYVNGLSNARLPIVEAVEDGWILADFDNSQPQYERETYAVIAVIDQRLRKPISFVQAVRRGLIDRETGNYVNNETGKKVYVNDAIRQGLIKTRRLDNSCGLDIFAPGNLVIEDGRQWTGHEV